MLDLRPSQIVLSGITWSSCSPAASRRGPWHRRSASPAGRRCGLRAGAAHHQPVLTAAPPSALARTASLSASAVRSLAAGSLPSGTATHHETGDVTQRSSLGCPCCTRILNFSVAHCSCFGPPERQCSGRPLSSQPKMPHSTAIPCLQAAGGSLGHRRHAAVGAAAARRALPLHAADAALGRGLGAPRHDTPLSAPQSHPCADELSPLLTQDHPAHQSSAPTFITARA